MGWELGKGGLTCPFGVVQMLRQLVGRVGGGEGREACCLAGADITCEWDTRPLCSPAEICPGLWLVLVTILGRE